MLQLKIGGSSADFFLGHSSPELSLNKTLHRARKKTYLEKLWETFVLLIPF